MTDATFASEKVIFCMNFNTICCSTTKNTRNLHLSIAAIHLLAEQT